MSSARQYADWHRESLRANRPDLYRQLREAGRLESHCRAVGRAAEETYDSTFSALRKKHLDPEGYLERVQHLNTLHSQVQEIVMQSVLVPDLETQRALERGGYD